MKYYLLVFDGPSFNVSDAAAGWSSSVSTPGSMLESGPVSVPALLQSKGVVSAQVLISYAFYQLRLIVEERFCVEQTLPHGTWIIPAKKLPDGTSAFVPVTLWRYPPPSATRVSRTARFNVDYYTNLSSSSFKYSDSLFLSLWIGAKDSNGVYGAFSTPPSPNVRPLAPAQYRVSDDTASPPTVVFFGSAESWFADLGTETLAPPPPVITELPVVVPPITQVAGSAPVTTQDQGPLFVALSQQISELRSVVVSVAQQIVNASRVSILQDDLAILRSQLLTVNNNVIDSGTDIIGAVGVPQTKTEKTLEQVGLSVLSGLIVKKLL